MKRLLFTLFALMWVFFVAACGQSGPLYLPGNPSKIQAPVAQPDETQQDTEENENNGEQ